MFIAICMVFVINYGIGIAKAMGAYADRCKLIRENEKGVVFDARTLSATEWEILAA